MLLFHIAFSLALITLVSGVAFFMWSTHVKSSQKKLIRIFGLVVVFFVVVNFLCTFFYGVKMWNNNFARPMMTYDKSAPGCMGGQKCMGR